MRAIRQQIIAYLKEKGPATVNDLAAAVNLTPMAVRYHLNLLQKDNLIAAPHAHHPGGRGRPQQLFSLTSAADQLFPLDYFMLTDYLLDELDVELGSKGIEALFSRIARRLVEEAPGARGNQTLEERLDEVVSFLQEKGFVVDWETRDNSYLIHAYSCPYRRMVKRHAQICLVDKQVISAMLNTTPIRTACLTRGDTHCIYQVPKPVQLTQKGAVVEIESVKN